MLDWLEWSLRKVKKLKNFFFSKILKSIFTANFPQAFCFGHFFCLFEVNTKISQSSYESSVPQVTEQVRSRRRSRVRRSRVRLWIRQLFSGFQIFCSSRVPIANRCTFTPNKPNKRLFSGPATTKLKKKKMIIINSCPNISWRKELNDEIFNDRRASNNAAADFS